ncbi:MAG: wax ester/triacylglycerol synthase domain-containing protein, partial [Actinomycetota bacterium]
MFLAVENDCNPMAIGSVGIFEGSPPTLQHLHSFLASRLSLVPRCRQRLRDGVGSLARPVWIDDVYFDLSHHVQEICLSSGDSRIFDDLVADVVATPLDRRRPLWNVRLITGLEDGRWAIVTQIHHCMVDGIAGSDLLGAVLTDEPSEDVFEPTPWTPLPEPTRRAIFWFTIRLAVRTGVTRLLGVPKVLAFPLRTMRTIRHVTSGAKRLWYRQLLQPSSLIGPIGTKRSWRHLDVQLSDVRSIQQSLGGTINDVVITAVTNGFRELLLARGETTTKRSVTAMVPVSLRLPTERGVMGNRVANVHAQLPIDESNPRQLFQMMRSQLNELKDSHEVDATG